MWSKDDYTSWIYSGGWKAGAENVQEHPMTGFKNFLTCTDAVSSQAETNNYINLPSGRYPGALDT